MIEAEEYGITSANADMMKTSDNPQIKRLVGAEGELGAAFGLDNEWSLRIIKQVCETKSACCKSLLMPYSTTVGAVEPSPALTSVR